MGRYRCRFEAGRAALWWTDERGIVAHARVEPQDHLLHVAPPELALRPVDERTVVEHLTAARVDVRRDVEHVVYGLYPATDRGVRHAVVIVGHFDPAAVSRFLATAQLDAA